MDILTPHDIDFYVIIFPSVYHKGVCVCDPGYFDDDCSVDINIAPTMFGIPDRGKCDLTQRECKMTAVKGGTFVDTTDLYCRLKPFMVNILLTLY